MDKYKKLAANTLIFAIGSFGSKLINILLIKLHTVFLEPSLFSQKDLIEQTANFLIPIFSFSIAEAIIRYGIDKSYNNKQVFSTGVAIAMLGATALALLSPLFNFVPYLNGYGFILYIYVYTSCFRSVCSQFVRAKGQVKLFAVDGILATLSILLFNVLFLVVLKWGVLGYLLSIILSDFCSGIFLCFMGNLSRYFDIKSIRPEIFKLMMKYSLPLIPTAIMWSITSVSDRIFVRYINGPEANGLYSAATKIPNLISIVSTIFFQAWNMSAISENDSKHITKFYTTVFSAYQSVMYIATAFLIALICPLTKLLMSENYYESYKYMPLLSLAVLMLSFSQFLSSVYNATQHTKNSFFTSLAAAGTNIVLNILLIPKWGVQGAAFATFVSYFICYIIRIFDTKRYINFYTDHMKVLMNMLVLGGMSAVLLIMPNGWIDYLIAGVCFITIVNFSAVIKTLKQIINRRKSSE